jgi:hypothetical protein
MRRTALATVAAALAAACAPTATPDPGQQPTPVRAPSAATPRDTTETLPAGYGSLRQDEVAIELEHQSLQLRMIPLDESVTRVLAPDSYRSLHGLLTSQRSALAGIQRRLGVGGLNVWYVSFFGREQRETRFSPMEILITSFGRDFRPLELIPLSPGFGDQRLRQRETKTALLVFDGTLDVNQPLEVSYEGVRNADWPETLARIERERSLIRSRARGGADRS